MSRVCVAVGFGGLAVGLGGCNMISGIGKDIQEMSQNTKNFIEGKKKPAPVPAAEAAPKKKRGLFG